jgi:drug/metabolite transporter (DMT)-like permease
VAGLWGGSPIIHKYLLGHIDFRLIMILGSFAYFTCIIILWICNWKLIREESKKLFKKPDLIFWAFLASILTAFLGTYLYFYVLKDNDSYIVTTLTYSSPVFTLLLAYLILNENITLMGLLGVILFIASILCFAWKK